MVEPRASDPIVVLIAEDDPAHAEIITLIVEQAGYAPLVARNGLMALELARKQRPALLITDLNMPELDGVELIAALRTEGNADFPILLVTVSPPATTDAIVADAVPRKPFHIAALEVQITQLLAS